MWLERQKGWSGRNEVAEVGRDQITQGHGEGRDR